MFFQVIQYLHFILKTNSDKRNIIHSPYLYDLISKIKYQETGDENKLLCWRNKTLKDKKIIDNIPYGASSRIFSGKRTTTGKIMKITGVPHKYGMLLFNITRVMKPETIIELGTGLGVSTFYLARGNPESKIFSIEVSEEKLNYAKTSIKKNKITNVEFLSGTFEDHLPVLLKNVSHPFLVFIDGNHKFEPTVGYFNLILKYAKENTIIIFDDIHWSAEMDKAWKLIILNSNITASIDLFRCGLIFFKKDIPKVDFAINF